VHNENQEMMREGLDHNAMYARHIARIVTLHALDTCYGRWVFKKEN